MSKKKKVALVPKLRFSMFRTSGEWDICLLKDLASRITVRNQDNSIDRILTNSAVDGVVDQSDYFDREVANRNNLENYFVVSKGDYVYNPRISATAPVGPVSKNKVCKGVMSPLYTVFRFKDNNDFYEQYFKTNLWHKYLKSISNTGARHDRMSISNDSFMDMPIALPSLKEQQKIADCLSSLDDLISTEKQKLETLKSYKKGLMQQLFPTEGKRVPKLRFPGFTGAWEQQKLGEIGTTFTGLSGKTKEDFGHGEAEFITYMNIFANPIASTDGTERVEVDSSQNEVKYGDVFFTTSSETPEEVGMSSIWLKNRSNVYLNSFCFGWRPAVKLDPHYLAFMLRSASIRKKIIFLAQGISRYNISKNRVMEISVPIPNLAEQKKIGAFFSNINHLITLHQHKLEALNMHKKGLLQGLFPSIDDEVE